MNKKYTYILFIALFSVGITLSVKTKKTTQIKSVVFKKNENKLDKKKSKFKYAIFDISGSFWNKSLYELLYAYQKTRGVPLSYYFKMIKFGTAHLIGTLNVHKAYESFLSYCKGMTKEEVQKNCTLLWEKDCKDFIFMQAKKLFKDCKESGAITILVDAGMSELYVDLLDAYPFDYICASELEYKDGVVTGKLLGKPCSGDEKLRKVTDIIEKKLGGYLKDAVFYATSHNDIPLLEKVGKPVVINPTSKLLAYAKKKGWKILRFKKT